MSLKVSNDGFEIEADLRVSLFGKSLGLMFRKNPKPLLFVFRRSRRVFLHMFFVFFPIDVVFLDSEREVVEIKEDFQPWDTYRSEKECRFVLELPEGSVEDNFQVGDNVELDTRKNI